MSAEGSVITSVAISVRFIFQPSALTHQLVLFRSNVVAQILPITNQIMVSHSILSY